MKKVGNSISGVLGGFVFLIIGVILLWWNEGNNVKNIKTTNEMSKVVVDVSSDKVEAANEGKLIATHGKLINNQTMVDNTFNVTLETPVLERIVEMYQWVEDSDTDEDGNTHYSYSKEWREDLVDSSSFHDSGHDNKTVKPYESETYTSTEVKVGAFDLSVNQINMLSTKGTFSDFNNETVTELGYKIVGTYVTNCEDIDHPNVGDVRISFKYNDSTEVSVLAVQSGKSFVDFVSEAGKSVNRVMDGSHSGADMINVIIKENNMLKWILRLVGVLILVMGFATILKPLSTISGFVPILGNVVSSAVGLISLLLGIALGCVVIAVAWIRFRPVLGIALLVAAVVAIVLVKKKTAAAPKEN